MKKVKKEIIVQNFIYEAETGTLYRLRFCANKKQSANTYRAKYIECGDFHTKGYVTFSYYRKKYYLHRFIWEMHNGKIPDGYLIDHINGDKKDNRLQNLRLVSNEESQKNRPLSKNNTSGHYGVYFSKRNSKWTAQVRANKKTIFLGYFKTKEEAIKVRKEAEKIHKYHENHGRVGAILNTG